MNDELQIDNLPNRLTMIRIFMIPLVIGSLYLVKLDLSFGSLDSSFFGWLGAWIFTIASITDFFDGYIARKKNIVTIFGSFLDPIADKFITVSALVMLLALDRLNFLVIIVLILREMYMTSLRLLANTQGISVPVSQMGKWKTALQMAGIPMLMVNEVWMFIPFPIMGLGFIYISTLLSLLSALTYSADMIKKLKQQKKLKKKKKKML